MGSWWLPERIDATLTRDFVVKQLIPEEIERLDRPVAFGGGDLTERTYWDSISQDARRLFLILLELGVVDQIFGIVDDGWNDDELPLGLEDIDRLQLTAEKNERMERRFHQRQYAYLLNPILYDEHQKFDKMDLVPIDVVEKPQGKASPFDRVKLPNAGAEVFTRRRFPLGNASGLMSDFDFARLVNDLRPLRNEHVVSYWASYTHLGYGYIIFTPPTEMSLKAFLANGPAGFKQIPKRERRELIMNWILCLTDALAYLHSRGRAHGSIKPSSIVLTEQYSILYVDPTRLSCEFGAGQEKSSFDREHYDYAAPEQGSRSVGSSSPISRKINVPGGYSVSPEYVHSYGSGSASSDAISSALQANTQQADIFSLGCIILELLSHLVKRPTGKFATFRSAKHKTAGRGGAVLDTSFHQNLSQVESWMSLLAKDASKKIADSEGGHCFRGFTPIMHIVTPMLSTNPYDRPSASQVQQSIYQVLVDQCEISEPHCVHQYAPDIEYSMSRMRLEDPSQRPAYPIPIQYRNNIGEASRPRVSRHVRTGSAGSHSQASGFSTRTGSSGETAATMGMYASPHGQARSSILGQYPRMGHWGAPGSESMGRGEPGLMYAPPP